MDEETEIILRRRIYETTMATNCKMQRIADFIDFLKENYEIIRKEVGEELSDKT